MKSKQINKTKILILMLIILLILIYPISILGRYAYYSAKDRYLASKKFYFESDTLKVSNPTYFYENWTGTDTYRINFHLYSYINELEKATDDLNYELSCSIESVEYNIDNSDVNNVVLNEVNGGLLQSGANTDDIVSCGINQNATQTVKSGVITLTNNNMAEEAVYLKANSPIPVGTIITINVEAKAVGTYIKTLKAKFEIKIRNNVSRYSVTDSSGSNYATLILTNPNDTGSCLVTLEFDPDLLRIDSTDQFYIENKDVGGRITTDSDGYVNKITFNLEQESTGGLKFYKTNTSENYTFSSYESGECIIDVSFQDTT